MSLDFPQHLPPPAIRHQLVVPVEFRVMGKGRPRFNGKTGCVHMSPNYTVNKTDIIWVLRQAMMFAPKVFDPVRSYVIQGTFYRVRRKPTSKKNAQELDILCPLGGLAPGTPDIDNALGTVMDAANKVIWGDDGQVVTALGERRWSEVPGAVIRFQQLYNYGEAQ